MEDDTASDRLGSEDSDANTRLIKEALGPDDPRKSKDGKKDNGENDNEEGHGRDDSIAGVYHARKKALLLKLLSDMEEEEYAAIMDLRRMRQDVRDLEEEIRGKTA